ncbi:MAG: hypothetical protein LIO97_11630 [Tannerellaceae bacterium]|nr:hypothetical protein [Tannerellaceae bacterium]
MAACALNTVYHFDIPYSGPIYKNAEIRGNQIELSFDYVYSGLENNGELKGFTICSADKQFVPAQAKIEGDKVIVWSEQVKEPVAIRYGWDNWSEGNLKIKMGFLPPRLEQTTFLY